MSKEEILAQIERAKSVVGTWPAWKQNILLYSVRPTMSAPRPQVNNTVGGSNAQSSSA